MGEDLGKPHDWDEFDAKYASHPLTPTEEREKELEEAKQEYFAELKYEADLRKMREEEQESNEEDFDNVDD